MMRGEVLILLYVLSTWGAALNVPAWARLLYRRIKEPAPGKRRNDVVLHVRIGLMLLSTGVAGVAGDRVLGAFLKGVPITMPSARGIVFIACMVIAEPFFLRVDEIHAQAMGRRSLGWRLYWAGAIAAVATFWFAIATT